MIIYIVQYGGIGGLPIGIHDDQLHRAGSSALPFGHDGNIPDSGYLLRPALVIADIAHIGDFAVQVTLLYAGAQAVVVLLRSWAPRW